MTALGQWVVIAYRYDRNPPVELYGPYAHRLDATVTAIGLRSRDAYETALQLQLSPHPEPEPDAS